MVEMVISGQGPTQLVYLLFVCVCFTTIKKRLEVMNLRENKGEEVYERELGRKRARYHKE